MSVVVYTTPTCGFCQQVKTYLRRRGVPFTEYDVSRDPQAAAEMVRLSGQRGVPVVLIDGQVVVGVNRPLIDQLLARRAVHPPRLGAAIADARLTSVSGWSVRGQWGGVRLSDLLAPAGPKPEATHVRFISYREIYTTCIPLDVALKERTLLAYEFDGEPLDSDYGGPVHIFRPCLWGYKSAKSVVAITLEDHSSPGFWFDIQEFDLEAAGHVIGGVRLKRTPDATGLARCRELGRTVAERVAAI